MEPKNTKKKSNEIQKLETCFPFGEGGRGQVDMK